MTLSIVRVTADTSLLDAAVATLLAELAQRPGEAGHVLRSRAAGLTQLARVESQSSVAMGASQCHVVFHPSDGLADLLAAVRAGDVDA